MLVHQGADLSTGAAVLICVSRRCAAPLGRQSLENMLFCDQRWWLFSPSARIGGRPVRATVCTPTLQYWKIL